MDSSSHISRLKKIAQSIRIESIRMIANAGSGHPAVLFPKPTF
jgi:transketolase